MNGYVIASWLEGIGVVLTDEQLRDLVRLCALQADGFDASGNPVYRTQETP